MRRAPPTALGLFSSPLLGPMADGPDPGSATPLTFQNFLEKMRHPSASELVKSVKSFISSFGTEVGVVDAEVSSKRIQRFLTDTERAFRGHSVWRNASDDELDASGEGLEKYLLTKLHPNLFGVTDDDKRADLYLSRRINALSTFIKPEHLDIPPSFRIEMRIALAEEELKKVNLFKAPRDKLVCVLNACRIITNALHAAAQKPSGADDFLPVLIFVVLRTNPAQFVSNLRFIQRYRLETRLVSEAAYFFTNLQSAASFLETCDHAQFTNLDADVFEAHMLAEGVDPAAERHPQGTMASQEGEDSFWGDAGRDAGDDKQTQKNQPSTTSSSGSDAAAQRKEIAELRKKLDHTCLELSQTRTWLLQWQSRFSSVDDVEVEGAASLAAENAAGTLRLPYKFAYARSDDLQVGDVPELVAGYKTLALQYEALVRGTQAMVAQGGEGFIAGSSTALGVPKNDSKNESHSKHSKRSTEPLDDVDGLGTFAEAGSSHEAADEVRDPFAGLVIGGGSSDASIL